MGTYIHFTNEQKERANSVDLEEFLRRRGEKLLRSGREFRLGGQLCPTLLRHELSGGHGAPAGE